MKRCLIITVCVVLGAMINLIVAWGCILNVENSETEPYGEPEESLLEWWRTHVPESWSDTPGEIAFSKVLGVDGYLYSEDKSDGPLFGKSVWRTCAGLPLRSMQGARFADQKQRRVWTESIVHFDGYWFIPAGPVPLEVRWPQTFFNTAFYALLLWLVYFAGVIGVRTSRRRKRLCASCAYDLRGGEHERCPECGNAIGNHGCAEPIA